MRAVFLDLASPDQRIALVQDASYVADIAVDDHKDEEMLSSSFEKLLSDHKWSFKDLTHVACVLGPGGFTTLRIGVAIANTLSWDLKIPSVGIHLSDLWKARIGDQDILWLHSTRKTQLFIRGFGTFATQWPETALVQLNDIRKSVRGQKYVGDLLPEHIADLKVENASQQIASLQDVLPTFLQEIPFNEGQTLMPWYGRSA